MAFTFKAHVWIPTHNIRLDEDVLSAFKELAADGGYQTLINQALQDWLAVRSVSELVPCNTDETYCALSL